MAPDRPGGRPHRLGVVTGLASETEVIEGLRGETPAEATVLCAGASTERAAAAARQLIDHGAEALLSFGIAGALAPDLESGELVVAHGVQGLDGYQLADTAWHSALAAKLMEIGLPYRDGALLGSPRALLVPGDKQSAFQASGCLAVDMESAAVAAAAVKAGLPFLAVRAVADRAADRLPAFVTKAVTRRGTPALGRVLAALLRRPGDVPATLGLARRTELALARLRMLAPASAELFGRF